MNDQLGDLSSVLAGRQVMYRFLARAFRKEVDIELLSEIGRLDLSANSGEQELDCGFRLLGVFVQTVDDATLIELAAEYSRIFLGIGNQQAGAAFPFESVYTSPRGLLMQEARTRLIELHRQESIQSSDNFHEMEDHVASELEFAAYLCEKTEQALVNNDEAGTMRYLQRQQAFFDHHLCAWVPRFCADVAQKANLDFYKAIAYITSGFLGLEYSLITDLLGVPSGQTV